MTLGSWRGSLFVMMCVLFTCIDVTGFMHWWGLTIDITSMNIIIISVGLCVDFCAHIVHGLLLLPVVLAILGPVEEENKKDAKRKARLLAANSHVESGRGGDPGGHAGGGDVKYNIENRLNQETEVRESVPEEQLLAGELAETVIA